MQYKKIIITITILIIISVLSYLSLFKDNLVQSGSRVEVNRTINIPKIVVPKKSIEFSITKDRNDNISFIGIFQDSNASNGILELLDKDKLEQKIKIDAKREENQEVISLVKKILSKFTENYIEWSLVYKDRKLLVSGDTTQREDRDRIERLLVISNIDSFNNIRVIYADIVSELSEKEQVIQVDIVPTEDEVKDIISNLKSLSIKESGVQESIKKEPKRVAHQRSQKGTIKQPIETPTPQGEKKIEDSPQMEPQEDIDSLPYVKFVEKEEPFNIKKHVVNEGTVYVEPPNENTMYEDIPLAKLHDIDENVDGIFIPEPINE
jgi:hypothetical protein